MESEVGPTDEKYDETIDAHEEHELLKKLAEAKEDQQFPDEIDTPQVFLSIHILKGSLCCPSVCHSLRATVLLFHMAPLPHRSITAGTYSVIRYDYSQCSPL